MQRSAINTTQQNTNHVNQLKRKDMTELSLYKFITDNNVEFHWHGEDVIAFIMKWDIKEWMELIPDFLTDEKGIECRMKQDYFCFWMKDICERLDIDINNVFKTT